MYQVLEVLLYSVVKPHGAKNEMKKIITPKKKAREHAGDRTTN